MNQTGILRPSLLGGVLLMLCACAPGPSTPTSVQQPAPDAPQKMLTMAVRSEPATLAALAPVGGGIPTSFGIRPFNALIELVDDHGVARPYLAEVLPELNTDSWTLLADGRMQTRYRLKAGLAWHDGASLTGDDFAFAWRIYSIPQLGLSGSLPLSKISAVTAPDPRTVIIDWNATYPRAGVLQVGAGNRGLPPLPKHLLGEVFDPTQPEAIANHSYWTTAFIGAGPYQLAQWEPGSFIEGRAFDKHALGRPKIDRIQVRFLSDSNTTVSYLRSGAVHLAADRGIDFDQALELKESATELRATVLKSAGAWRSINIQHRPDVVRPAALQDARVRRALASSMDRRPIDEALFSGQGLMAETIVNPALPYFPTIGAAITRYPFDLRRTEQLLAEAGFERQGNSPWAKPGERAPTFQLLTNASPLNQKEIAVIANGWRQAGFDMEEATLPIAQAQDSQVRASFPALFDTATSGDESNLVESFTSGQIANADNRWRGANLIGWSDHQYDQLAVDYATTLNPAERLDRLTQMARILSDQVPSIPVYWNLDPTFFIDELEGPVQTSPPTTGAVSWNIWEWHWR